MKKVFRILLILSILCLSGCDFMRRVAGRPTGAELERKALKLEQLKAEKTAGTDSADVSAAKAEAALQELERMDVKLSSVFRFGTPAKPVKDKYSIIVGVFRNAASASRIVEKAKAKGFGAYLIRFPDGVNAVCLDGGGSPAAFPELITKARKEGLCPSDAWIYVKKD
ncbi:MAG: hypothetical protein MJY49_02490 [Bacteroidales bacterium]|nr:hypothetical protein [Bacteroidales bacterium]